MLIFMVWIVFVPLEQKTSLNCTKKVYENINFCNVTMPSEDTKLLEFNKNQESDKALFGIYDVLESIMDKIEGCKNNPLNSSTTKVSEHISSGFSMSTITSFRTIENKHDVYSGKHLMKKFCKSLREHAMKIINFKK